MVRVGGARAVRAGSLARDVVDRAGNQAATMVGAGRPVPWTKAMALSLPAGRHGGRPLLAGRHGGRPLLVGRHGPAGLAEVGGRPLREGAGCPPRTSSLGPRHGRGAGFTLIEVLVVVSVIALLIAILLPSLAKAREQSRGVVCLSNLKQVGTGLTMYTMSSKDRYPQHSSPSSTSPRTRWPDYLHRHMRSEDVYSCPSLSDGQRVHFNKPWAHNLSKQYGGYGYNFQYLGNARTGTAVADWTKPYFAPVSAIRRPAVTIAIADTQGSRKGNADNLPGQDGAAVYVVDPPLGSKDLGSKGARQSNNPSLLWYEGGSDPVADEESWRSRPDDRHGTRSNVVFADGHAEPMQVKMLDGRAAGGAGDNRYYNGLFDAGRW